MTYAILGPYDISSLDFISYYGPKIEDILEEPNSIILIDDQPGVGRYTARYLSSRYYRNGKMYHLGNTPRYNLSGFECVGGFSTLAEMEAQMIVDADVVIRIQ